MVYSIFSLALATWASGSRGDEPLDLSDWVRCHFLRDFADHTLDDIRMEGLAQASQYFRRGDNDKLFKKIGVRVAIERVGKFAGKPLLGDVVPVGFFHSALGNARACAGSSGTIGALLTCGRIVARENSLDDKLDTLGVAFIAQEESLLTIANEKEGVMGNMRSWF